jgi:hypothetical protein
MHAACHLHPSVAMLRTLLSTCISSCCALSCLKCWPFVHAAHSASTCISVTSTPHMQSDLSQYTTCATISPCRVMRSLVDHCPWCNRKLTDTCICTITIFSVVIAHANPWRIRLHCCMLLLMNVRWARHGTARHGTVRHGTARHTQWSHRP